MKKNNGENTPITIAVIAVFTIGVIIGAMFLFYVPDNIMSDARNSFDIVGTVEKNFWTLYKNNLLTESFWIMLVWVLGYSSLTAPLTSVVVGIRGFLIGFSIEFIITGKTDFFKIFLKNILPQCMVALPVMTIFAILCLKFSVERKRGGDYEGKYPILCVMFLLIVAFASAVETLMVKLFINIL